MTALLLKALSSYPSFLRSSALLPSAQLLFFLTLLGRGFDGAAQTGSLLFSVFPMPDPVGDYHGFWFNLPLLLNSKSNISHHIIGYLDILEHVQTAFLISFEIFQFILQALER